MAGELGAHVDRSGPLTISQAVRFAMSAGDPADRRKLIVLAAVLTAVGVLDVAGVLALGAASAWLLSSSTGQTPSNLPVSLPGLDPSSPDFDVWRAAIILLSVGIALLLVRTILSILGTRRLVLTSFRLNKVFSNRLWQRMLLTPQAMAGISNSNNVAYALNYGATGATATIISAFILLVSDAFLVAILAVTVLVLSPIAGVIAAAVFGIAGLLFVKFLAPRSHAAASDVGRNNVEVDTITRDGIHAYKETAVSGAIPWAEGRLAKARHQQLDNQASLAFLLLLPRYAAEIVLIASLAAVGAGIMISSQGATAAALLVSYAAAASRIMPAVVRIQSAFVQIRMGSGSAELTYDLVESLDGFDAASRLSTTGASLADVGSAPAVALSDVSFSYGGSAWGLKDANLVVERGEFVALVGPSGAGKTTLANVVLGLLAPDVGAVQVLGTEPGNALFASGKVAYVPQDAWIVHGSVRENVTLGRDVTDDEVMATLATVGLAELVASWPDGLDSRLDEKGGNLSGGQRQRLGLARALVAGPDLIVLDEATSALDSRSEEAIGKVVAQLKGACALLVIAHRLRTVVDADAIVYLDRGEIVARGTFAALQADIPDFAEQAHLAGMGTT